MEDFENNYDNYQQSSLRYIDDDSPACSMQMIRTACALTLRTDNAARARVRGIEGDFMLKVGREGTLGGNVLYNDARFLEFSLLNAFANAVTNFGGVSLANITRSTVSGDYAHEFPLANGGAINFAARTIYRSAAFLWFEQRQSQFQDANFAPT